MTQLSSPEPRDNLIEVALQQALGVIGDRTRIIDRERRTLWTPFRRTVSDIISGCPPGYLSRVAPRFAAGVSYESPIPLNFHVRPARARSSAVRATGS